MDLTEFLLARIAEDESEARAATPGPWIWDDDNLISAASPDEAVVITDGGAYPPTGETADFIATHSPDRVLAECEAKRRIVADPEPQYRADYHGWHITKQSMLRYLAAVYSDHADYRPEWRP